MLVYRGLTVGWIKMRLSKEVGLGPGDLVLDGNPAPLSKKGAHVYCGQTVGWIIMPVYTKVGLGPGHILLDGDPAPPAKKAHIPFSAYVYCDQTVAHLSYC